MRRWFDAGLDWLFRQIGELWSSPGGRWTMAIMVIALTLVILGRAVLAGYVPYASARLGDGLARVRRDSRDPWLTAQQLAAAGQYLDAAHELYRALLGSVSARSPLRLHPSKTAGDYARDLRRTAPTIFPPFRAFARDYELVVYRDRDCDRAQYEQLTALASHLDSRFVSHGDD